MSDAGQDADQAARQEAAYRAFVAEAAAAQTPSRVMMNRTPSHAAIILEALFKGARRRVCILAQALSPDVYDQPGVVAAAAAMLDRSPEARLDILIEEALDEAKPPLLLTALKRFGERVAVTQVPGWLAGIYQYNFAVADGESYRFEESRHLKEAYVEFHETGFARQLEDSFDKLLSQAAAR